MLKKNLIINSLCAMTLVFVAAAPPLTVQAKQMYKLNAKKQLVTKKTGKLVKGFKMFKQKLYKNGRLYTGVYKKYMYKNGVRATGKLKGKMYRYGKLLTGYAGKEKKYYEKGLLKTGFVHKKYFVKGVLASGVYHNKLYKKGELYVGIHVAQKKIYQNGIVAKGVITWKGAEIYVVNGVKQGSVQKVKTVNSLINTVKFTTADTVKPSQFTKINNVSASYRTLNTYERRKLGKAARTKIVAAYYAVKDYPVNQQKKIQALHKTIASATEKGVASAAEVTPYLTAAEALLKNENGTLAQYETMNQQLRAIIDEKVLEKNKKIYAEAIEEMLSMQSLFISTDIEKLKYFGQLYLQNVQKATTVEKTKDAYDQLKTYVNGKLTLASKMELEAYIKTVDSKSFTSEQKVIVKNALMEANEVLDTTKVNINGSPTVSHTSPADVLFIQTLETLKEVVEFAKLKEMEETF